MPCSQKLPRQTGFTLLELVLVLAMLSLLLAFAVPNYQHQQQSARRSEARHTLLQAAQSLGEEYSVTQRYETDIQKLAPASAYYRYRFAFGPDAEGFVLEAVPLGAQAQDTCGSLLLDHRLVKGAQGVLDNRAAKTLACWEH